jgi:DNA-directed RNA polymerase beta subunit
MGRHHHPYQYDPTEVEEFVCFEPSVKETNSPSSAHNQNMTSTSVPWRRGQRVKKGDITRGLRPHRVASWRSAATSCCLHAVEGLKYEDAIVLMSGVVREDLLTSVHVDEFPSKSADQRGVEELTPTSPTSVRTPPRT